jgi:PhnB protein
MRFYAACLGGEITDLNTFGESPMEVPEAFKNKVLHCSLRAGNLVLMASDNMPDMPAIETGNATTLMIGFGPDDTGVDALFNRLAEGGTVVMPLENTFWGARFGTLVDKYGFTWSVNQELNAQ